VGSETEKPPVTLDRAITFAPSGDVVVAALSSLRKGGVVAINAIHLDRIPQFDYDSLLWGERQIRSVANMTRDDARDFLATAGNIGLRPRVTAFSLDQANEALLAIKNDSIDGGSDRTLARDFTPLSGCQHERFFVHLYQLWSRYPKNAALKSSLHLAWFDWIRRLNSFVHIAGPQLRPEPVGIFRLFFYFRRRVYDHFVPGRDHPHIPNIETR